VLPQQAHPVPEGDPGEDAGTDRLEDSLTPRHLGTRLLPTGSYACGVLVSGSVAESRVELHLRPLLEVEPKLPPVRLFHPERLVALVPRDHEVAALQLVGYVLQEVCPTPRQDVLPFLIPTEVDDLTDDDAGSGIEVDADLVGVVHLDQGYPGSAGVEPPDHPRRGGRALLAELVEHPVVLATFRRPDHLRPELPVPEGRAAREAALLVDQRQDF